MGRTLAGVLTHRKHRITWHASSYLLFYSYASLLCSYDPVSKAFLLVEDRKPPHEHHQSSHASPNAIQPQHSTMELFVVLPATTSSGSTSRTVALEVGSAGSTTVRDLKKAIQHRSAQVYGSTKTTCGIHNISKSRKSTVEKQEEECLKGIPAGLQRLTLGGRHLRDEQTLAESAVVGYVRHASLVSVYL